MKELPNLQTCSIAVVGLGYVGLPIALEFSKVKRDLANGNILSRRVIGYDINEKRLDELKDFHDRTNEITSDELRSSSLEFTNKIEVLEQADVFIVCVPTPVDSGKRPDLLPLKKASQDVGLAISRRRFRDSTVPVIIFESTVYPGVTEDVCAPIIEFHSGLRFNHAFVCGYSPERINPGDKEHQLTNITKVTSGSTNDAAVWIDKLYKSIIKAGTHLASSIKVAEAAKVIENTQRDLNIALINELAIIFKRLGIDTLDVLNAASTKWNFISFKPGLVGGHCIGVDPYYLTYKAELSGYYPHLILAGRRINDGMGHWIAEQSIVEALRRNINTKHIAVLILGFSFKEDCNDLRNTRVVDVYESFKQYSCQTTIVDPVVDKHEAKFIYDIDILDSVPADQRYSIVVVSVAHQHFTFFSHGDWLSMLAKDGFIFDLKGIVPRELKPIRP